MYIMAKKYYIADFEMAKRLGIERRSVVQLIKKYQADFEELGSIISEVSKADLNSKGRPEILYYFSAKEQYWLLVSYVKNTEKSQKLKKEIVAEIFSLNKKSR